MFATFSKEEVKKLIKDAPPGSGSNVIAGIIARGHSIEGYTPTFKDKGDKGSMGPTGPQGPAGLTGPQGPKGEVGSQGPMGPMGKTGNNGRDGRDGRDGKDGSPDTGDEIIMKINESTEQIEFSRIKNVIFPPSHGGFGGPVHVGSFETPIRAGTNITVTKDAFGNWVISSTASGSGTWYEEVLTRTDGVNYTLGHTPTAILNLFLNGQKLVNTVDYTRVGAAITILLSGGVLASDTLSATYS